MSGKLTWFRGKPSIHRWLTYWNGWFLASRFTGGHMPKTLRIRNSISGWLLGGWWTHGLGKKQQASQVSKKPPMAIGLRTQARTKQFLLGCSLVISLRKWIHTHMSYWRQWSKMHMMTIGYRMIQVHTRNFIMAASPIFIIEELCPFTGITSAHELAGCIPIILLPMSNICGGFLKFGTSEMVGLITMVNKLDDLGLSHYDLRNHPIIVV